MNEEAKSPTYEEECSHREALPEGYRYNAPCDICQLTKELSDTREQLEKEHGYWRETRNANVDLVNNLKRLDCGKHGTDKNEYKPDGCLWCRQLELSKENGSKEQEITKLREQVRELRGKANE